MQDEEETVNHFFIHPRMCQSFDAIFFRNMVLFMQDEEESINHFFIHLRMCQSFDTIFFRNMALCSAFLAPQPV